MNAPALPELPTAPHRIGDIDLYPESLVREIIATTRATALEEAAKICDLNAEDLIRHATGQVAAHTCAHLAAAIRRLFND